VSKASTHELMRQCDLVVATGSQANVRAAYTCGTPAFGVGAGNVAGIVDDSADVAPPPIACAAQQDLRQRHQLFVGEQPGLVAAVRDPMLAALRGAAWRGDARRDQKATAAGLMWPDGKPVGRRHRAVGPAVAERAGLAERGGAGQPTMLMVEEDGFGARASVTRARSSARCWRSTARAISAAAGDRAPHLCLPGRRPFGGPAQHRGPSRRMALGLTLPVSRVIVDQAHCIATGGSFDNGLPFSLSMGCGTWGGNNFSDNMNYRHYLNITRISRPSPSGADRAGDLRRLLRQIRAAMSVDGRATVRELIDAPGGRTPQAVYALATESGAMLTYGRAAAPAAAAWPPGCSARAWPGCRRCRW
jgi:sulfoacetaldehyde dehydrogenase